MSAPVHVEKHSVSIPASTSEGIRARVGSRGFSSYVAGAVARHLERDALEDALGRMEPEHAPVDEDAVVEIMERLTPWSFDPNRFCLTRRRCRLWPQTSGECRRGRRRTDSSLHVSDVTVAEATDGTARDAAIRRTTKALRLEPVTEEVGYQAGALRAAAVGGRRKAHDLTVDAVVAATALTLPRPAVVLTSDPADLELLLADSDHVQVDALT